ncbi:glutamine--fructose-6-phosphate transaminase (isomerizing) [Candidatus Hydrogenosomobacter endosymbioticus]|uniref:Glutamine--fructose-6-phosphate aminotransferase [isomerizing] n=1 Tax=Candidatus Hydrogenosomobacter endosymbioticus TaxID=2558174 RepID=A0ABN6L2H8_9PROT|nr:glutamine--fructose-6-phosphate transaminase (isomerizing) [Candidatus Hydrogenosomobacter endosymbioticus]BDB96085.1 glutamine--fructose-6-phosphate aminotransferase [isomerizing] [Candidatus Hydrogenosomobacter endosymbioticus]
MCSIIGIVGDSPVVHRLLDALGRLEYRGYDSAGISVTNPAINLGDTGNFLTWRSVGRVKELSKKIDLSCKSTVGIGHTRWATHGKPTERNAHPHTDGFLSVVHNGIIENFSELKTELIQSGIVFQSDTDTEVLVHLLSKYIKKARNLYEANSAAEATKSPDDIRRTILNDAIQNVLKKICGSFAFAALCSDFPETILAARSTSCPLAVGKGINEFIVCSDAFGMAGLSSELHYLDDYTYAIVSRRNLSVFGFGGEKASTRFYANPFKQESSKPEEQTHYMLKEIHEQPLVIQRLLDKVASEREIYDISSEVILDAINGLTLTACGTAFYACMIGRYFLQTVAGIRTDIELASEFQSAQISARDDNRPVLAVSQSGETADTIKALAYAKERGQKIFSIVNVPQSSLARMSHKVFYTHAGPEVGVATTKAFTAQVFVLLSMAIEFSKKNYVNFPSEALPSRDDFRKVVGYMTKTLSLDSQSIDISNSLFRHAKNILYIGRGLNYYMCLEGALKMKEISYIHAEGVAAGELKHGPIALIEDGTPVVVLAPFDDLFAKTMSNMQEVAARGAKVVLITDEIGMKHVDQSIVHSAVMLPHTHKLLTPLICAIPMQLFAYYTALARGCDIDKPRNLAKSVTVE